MSYFPSKKNAAYVFYRSLVSQADPSVFQTNPTIAAGDFKVSIDGGALANLTNLPAVTPAGSKIVQFALTGAEMNGDSIVIVGSDPDAEWNDIFVELQTTLRQIDELAYPAVTGRSLAVDPSGEVTVATNNDKTAYSLSQAFPANFADLAIAALTGKVAVATNDDKTGYGLANPVSLAKNAALAKFPFVMYDSTGTPTAALVVTAGVSIDGAALAPCTNAVVELSNGVYNIDLGAADTNGTTLLFRFSAAGAVDTFISVVTNQ